MSDAATQRLRILYHHRTRSKDGQSVHIEELTAALRRLGHEIVMAEPGGVAEGGAGKAWSRTNACDSTLFPWAWVDSNYRPHAYQAASDAPKSRSLAVIPLMDRAICRDRERGYDFLQSGVDSG